jgi:hypothetical protein
MTEDYCVCQKGERMCLHHQHEADENPRLYSAAPDLLAALKRLVAVGCCAGEGVIEAEAAIAKAEGK